MRLPLGNGAFIECEPTFGDISDGPGRPWGRRARAGLIEIWWWRDGSSYSPRPRRQRICFENVANRCASAVQLLADPLKDLVGAQGLEPWTR